ncbi:MAG: AAA family ATPase [Klebsiella michiganensis]|nr:AAA family ATPase [Klebsiella michiganensis]
MSHRLSNISIKNFRSCKEINLNFSLFTPLIGYNNAGKSTILNAIECYLRKRYCHQAITLIMITR